MKIAIYSGTIPSTTFIENLVCELACTGKCTIYLFGSKTAQVKYNSHVKQYIIPQKKIALWFYVLGQLFQLLVHHPRNLILLYGHLKSQKKVYKARLWAKYLPVINHLPDIFHIQWAKSIEEWLFLKNIFKVKVVVSFRGTHINSSPVADIQLAESYRRSFPFCDAFHCVSKAIALEGVKYGASIEKATVIYPAVDRTLFETNHKKVQGTKLRILSVGRDHWKKGYWIALDAMALLKKHGFDFKYTIIAGGEKEELKYQVSDLELNQYVSLMDGMPHNRVLQFYCESDLLLLPSFEEGVANVVLEAMALNVPVISTNCGGMEEVINHGFNGWIVPIRNSQAIAEQIIDFLTLNKAQIQTIVDNARETIRKNHLLEYQAEEMIKFYQKVL